MGVLDAGGDFQRSSSLGVNLGHTCVKVREPIMLSFEVVSRVVRGMGALDGRPRARKERGGLGGFVPIGLNGIFVEQKYIQLLRES